MQKESSGASGQSDRIDSDLFLLFAIPVLLVFLVQLAYAVSWNPADPDFNRSYPTTEWLINYQGGFLRRGLPGSLLFLVLEVLPVSPQILTVLFATAVFLLFCWYLFTVLNGLAPRWLLLTAPLLGYPVYMDQILAKKDVFLILLLAVSLRLSIRFGGRRWAPPLVALIMSVAILSHEAMAFFGLPALILMIVLQAVTSTRGPWFQQVIKLAGRWVWMAAPLVSLVVSARRQGTLAQGQRILDSIRFALPPAARFHGRPGAIHWIGKPVEMFVADAHRALANPIFGVPAWVYVLGLILSGALLIAAVLLQRSEDASIFFLMACLVQLAAMAPLFYLAKDHGRWASLVLLTAFLLTVESTWPMRSCCHARVFEPLKDFLFSIPEWLPPVGLLFWGMPIGIYSLFQIFYSSPAGASFKAYFLMRMMGMPLSG